MYYWRRNPDHIFYGDRKSTNRDYIEQKEKSVLKRVKQTQQYKTNYATMHHAYTSKHMNRNSSIRLYPYH